MSTRAPTTGGILALDVGDARIGVAVSESRIIAQTLDAIERRAGRTATLDALQKLVDDFKVGLVLVGLPVLESGAEGEQVEKTRAFARSLARRIPAVRIEFRDERYTSSQAREILGGGRQPKGRVDSVAAAVILQEYLDQTGGGREK